MAEDVRIFFFDHKELVEDMIIRQGLHEGLWRLTIELGLSANNVNVLKDGKTTFTPAGVVLVSRIGIARASELDDLTLDAAEVNPREPAKSTKPSKKSK